MDLFLKCLACCFLGFLVDVVQTVHIQACAGRQISLAVVTIILIYFVGFFGHDWFVRYTSFKARMSLTMSGALGAGLGTGIVIYFS